MKIQFTGLLLIAALFLLAACGQKGPLYLKKDPVPAAAAELEKESAASKTESTDAKEKSEK